MANIRWHLVSGTWVQGTGTAVRQGLVRGVLRTLAQASVCVQTEVPLPAAAVSQPFLVSITVEHFRTQKTRTLRTVPFCEKR